MTVVKNDEVIITTSFKNLIPGKVYEVANFTDDHIILRDANTKIATASIHVDDFDKYFVLNSEFNGWTEWTALMNPDRQAYFYRTNGKKVQVKSADTCGEASCNTKHGDVFDLSFGIQLALLDCKIRSKANVLECLTKEMENRSNVINRLVDESVALNETKRKLINSYYFSNKEDLNVSQ